jgi:hypothetical protein
MKRIEPTPAKKTNRGLTTTLDKPELVVVEFVTARMGFKRYCPMVNGRI